VHHNGVLGIGGVTDTTEVRGNEISHNNYLGLGNMDVEAGGTKFVLSHHLRLVGNFVHHNSGVGLWLDIDNDATTVDSNTVEDNAREGIVSEISYSASIHDNTVNRNGLTDTRRTAWPWGAGIGIHASGGSGIEVYRNTLSGNAHGIALIQQSRGSGAMGPHYVQHVAVHDNIVTCGTGSLSVAAAVVDAGDTAIFASRGVSFRANTYTELSKCAATTPRGSVGTGGFAWRNGWRTSSQWQAFGLDTDGSFLH
jgi:parallel beta-helix repeat protein